MREGGEAAPSPGQALREGGEAAPSLGRSLKEGGEAPPYLGQALKEGGEGATGSWKHSVSRGTENSREENK